MGKEGDSTNVSRRGFVGAAAALGAFALSDSRGTAYAEGQPIRIMPASPLAQSALLIFAPEMIASLVASIPQAELPNGFDYLEDLPVTGRLDENDPARFELAARELSPSFILDVGVYPDEHWSFLKTLGERLTVYTVPVDIGGLTVFDALKAASEQLPKKADGAKLEILSVMERAMIRGIESVDVDERYTVCMGNGRDDLPFARKSPERRMLLESCSKEWAESEGHHIYDDDGPQVILCISEKSWKGYMAKEHEQYCWVLSPAGKTSCVLPAFVGGVQWVSQMSPFAKMSLGALWLGNLLYPEAFAFDIDGMVRMYYEGLHGSKPKEVAVDEGVGEALSAFGKMARAEVVEAQQAYVDRRAVKAASLVARAEEAANREPTGKELRELYGILERAAGRKPSEEDTRLFIEKALKAFRERGE